MIPDQSNADGSVFLKVLVKPLVNLIWLAGFIFLGGSLIALWPDAARAAAPGRPLRRRGRAGVTTLALLLGALLAVAAVLSPPGPSSETRSHGTTGSSHAASWSSGGSSSPRSVTGHSPR